MVAGNRGFRATSVLDALRGVELQIPLQTAGGMQEHRVLADGVMHWVGKDVCDRLGYVHDGRAYAVRWVSSEAHPFRRRGPRVSADLRGIPPRFERFRWPGEFVRPDWRTPAPSAPCSRQPGRLKGGNQPPLTRQRGRAAGDPAFDA